MTELDIISIIENLGFPIFISVVLLYDKMKSNGSLLKVVENNNQLLKKIESVLNK